MTIKITPKQKAESLFASFYMRVDGVRTFTRMTNAKELGDIFCDEMMTEIDANMPIERKDERLEYWKEVNQEIQNK